MSVTIHWRTRLSLSHRSLEFRRFFCLIIYWDKDAGQRSSQGKNVTDRLTTRLLPLPLIIFFSFLYVDHQWNFLTFLLLKNWSCFAVCGCCLSCSYVHHKMVEVRSQCHTYTYISKFYAKWDVSMIPENFTCSACNNFRPEFFVFKMSDAHVK